MKRSIILIGYSGHGFVAYGIFQSGGYTVIGYCDNEEKYPDPFSISYFGKEK